MALDIVVLSAGGEDAYDDDCGYQLIAWMVDNAELTVSGTLVGPELLNVADPELRAAPRTQAETQ